MNIKIKEWFIIILSLADDAAVALLVLLGLWLAGIAITIPVIFGIILFFILLAFVMHRLIIPVLRRKPVTGAEGMTGTAGKAISPLKPEGLVRVKGEYWQAISMEGNIERGERVIVVSVERITLRVRRG